MATPKKKATPARSAADSSAAVDAYLAKLEHPDKAAILLLRTVLRDVNPSISEGVKWNAPSFKTTEYFATMNLAPKGGLRLVLHLGAKVRAGASVEIKDPQGLLSWLAKDRALVSFENVEDVQASKAALQAIVRQWIRFV